MVESQQYFQTEKYLNQTVFPHSLDTKTLELGMEFTPGSSFPNFEITRKQFSERKIINLRQHEFAVHYAGLQFRVIWPGGQEETVDNNSPKAKDVLNPKVSGKRSWLVVEGIKHVILEDGQTQEEVNPIWYFTRCTDGKWHWVKVKKPTIN